NGYTPRNGVYYKPYTTHEGILEKYKDGDEEFDVPDQLLALLQGNDFGRYADANGDLPVAFLASNHTTGGNSGSPVLNANGELIGTNFDRVWEGTMSDIMYDFDRCRNISVDIRYTMFITEYLGGARWVIDEILQTK
ncbi:MAG TPA: S46 family peptidase, partial [Chitinophagales bacterium]|nr:S46 family peptidase [Chitinophagales bacterium]